MMAGPPFGTLRMFGYNVIYADPPWPFENYSTKGESRNPNKHYDTMPIEAIKALPVGELARGDCACLLWVTDPILDQGIEVLRAWGFRYKTVGFYWAKRTASDQDWHLGTGYYTRANPEICLLGMMGSLPVRDRGVRKLIVEPVREHSRKPDRVPGDIVRLFGDLPRVELFCRTRREGWDVWGNEVGRLEEGVQTSRGANGKGRLPRGEEAGPTQPGEIEATPQQTERAWLL